MSSAVGECCADDFVCNWGGLRPPQSPRFFQPSMLRCHYYYYYYYDDDDDYYYDYYYRQKGGLSGGIHILAGPVI